MINVECSCIYRYYTKPKHCRQWSNQHLWRQNSSGVQQRQRIQLNTTRPKHYYWSRLNRSDIGQWKLSTCIVATYNLVPSVNLNFPGHTQQSWGFSRSLLRYIFKAKNTTVSEVFLWKLKIRLSLRKYRPNKLTAQGTTDGKVYTYAGRQLAPPPPPFPGVSSPSVFRVICSFSSTKLWYKASYDESSVRVSYGIILFKRVFNHHNNLIKYRKYTEFCACVHRIP